ncbi:hypothetical protein KUTeg_006099 [Tegillarca granosa]|uniref:Ig-like domain-containing protein n=1 Tax=Tegillarca granosa TaxID=220873 RepID=A0ABQ9FFK8_TEGGR|nr:hypothetical protein KUTeg_006099 [Tegillarca granosa]
MEDVVSLQGATITEDTVYIMNNVVGQVTCTLYGNYGVTSQSVTITEDTVYIINNAVGQVSCTLTGSCSAINWYFSSISVPVSTSFIGFSCQNTTNGFYQTCDYSNHQYTLYFTGTTNLHGQTIRCSGGSCSPQQTVSDTATISVIDPPDDSNAVMKQGNTISTIEGKSTTLVCEVRGDGPADNVLRLSKSYITNFVGTTKSKSDTIVRGKPDQPIGGLAICIDYNSAVITWVSGFDNGDKQTFTVVFQEKGETEQSSFKTSSVKVLDSQLTVQLKLNIIRKQILAKQRYQAKAKGTNNKTDSQRDGRQKQNYETMQTLNDEQPYEQIKMEDISETSDADAIYVNTTIR